MKLLGDLNQQQKKAVTHGDGPLLILAGAGSGKTMTVTHRIAYLIQKQGVKPDEILAVTFTNKAAGEMRKRVEKLLGRSTRGLWISTFHSACARILRENIDLLGYSKNFSIIDKADSVNLIKSCMKDMGISERLYSPRATSLRISQLKSSITLPEEFEPDAQPMGLDSKVARIYPVYQERLKAADSLDFDDLLMLTVLLFRRKQNVLNQYRKTFKHVIVDEYQDTNFAQYTLVKMLAGTNKSVCVVGDDDQSIYSFRGADLRNILEFEKDFPGCEVVKLEQNYRSTQCILDSAWSLVNNNPLRKPKKLWTDLGAGEKVEYLRLSDELAEAQHIARQIKKLAKDGASHSDCAVLYRTNTQARTIEEALRREGLPYRVIGGMKFYDRKEIKDIICYLKVISNPRDSVSLKRIVNTPPRGIGEATLKKAAQLALPDNLPLIECLEKLLDDEGLASGPKNSIRKFLTMFNGLVEAKGTMAPSQLVEKLVEDTRYIKYIKDSLDLEAQTKKDNIYDLLESIRDFEESSGSGEALEDYLAQVALITDWDVARSDTPAVTLMTLHLSKGLEFPNVFITGLEEGLIPHAQSQSDDAELEEERRLLYVGMTRARQRLFLTNAVTRRLAGLTQNNRVSRFVEEIPEDLICCRRIGISRKPIASASPSFGLPQRKAAASSGCEVRGFFKTGASVTHPVWGSGVVEKTEGRGDTMKVTVLFKSVGKKKLMARMAGLERG